MSERTDLLGRVRIATPCPASWESMEGGERVRFCRQCNLNVYNLSEMTSREAEALVACTEGRLCARMYLRADGTVLTKDCPTGLRAVRRRVSRAAGAALTALISLYSVASGQTPIKKQRSSCPGQDELRIEKTTHADSYSTVSGVVTDMQCAFIGGAEVRLKNRDTGRTFNARTSDEGEFHISALPLGTYKFEITSPGFAQFQRNDLYIGAGEEAHVRVTLRVMFIGEIITIETKTKPDIESRAGSTIFRGRAITDLPIPR